MGCGSSTISDEELEMRNVVMKAAKTNDLDLMRKAINDIKEKYNDEKKTRSACNMYDFEEGGARCMSALKWAAEKGNAEMCQLLVETGSTVDGKMYANKSHNGRFESPGGVTALMSAAREGKLEAAKYLVEAGADVDYRDISGHSAQDLAGIGGHMEVQQFLKEAAIAKLRKGDTVKCETTLEGKGGKVEPGDIGTVLGPCEWKPERVMVNFPNYKSPNGPNGGLACSRGSLSKVSSSPPADGKAGTR